MHSSDIYTKTELGVRELRERHLNLPLPLRSLLIMIDGNRTVANVLEKARAQGAITVGITNEPRSALAQIAEHVFLVRAGPDEGKNITTPPSAEARGLIQKRSSEVLLPCRLLYAVI